MAMFKKILVFLAGSLFALVLLEIFLRVLGAMNATRPVSSVPVPAGSYKILCLGDSFTFGLGVPADKSYPAQLEQLLNRNREGRRFRVFNYGRPGQNTSQLLERLPAELAEVRPDMVVLLSGGANIWNFLGYHAWQATRGRGYPGGDFLYRIRVFKLVKLLAQNILGPSRLRSTALDYQNTGKYEEAVGALQARLRVAGKKAPVYHELGTVHHVMRDYRDAVAWFRKGIESDPLLGANYLALASVYLDMNKYDDALAVYAEGAAAGIPASYFATHVSHCRGRASADAWRFGEAAAWYEKGIAADPSNHANYQGLGRLCIKREKYGEALTFFQKAVALAPRDSVGYCDLGSAYELLGKKDEANRAYRQGIAVSPNQDYNFNYCAFMRTAYHSPAERPTESLPVPRDIDSRLAQDSLSMMSGVQTVDEIDAKITQWVESDIAAMVRACLKLRIRVLIQNYPCAGATPPDIILRKIARIFSLPFVDNVASFGALFSRGAAFQDYYVPDGHCNERGYGVMAKNIGVKILEILPAPDNETVPNVAAER